MRMRTMPEAIAVLQSEDPDTALTLSALRRLVKQGVIPSCRVGNKTLLDVDELPKHLFKALCPAPVPGVIRPIRE